MPKLTYDITDPWRKGLALRQNPAAFAQWVIRHSPDTHGQRQLLWALVAENAAESLAVFCHTMPQAYRTLNCQWAATLMADEATSLKTLKVLLDQPWDRRQLLHTLLPVLRQPNRRHRKIILNQVLSSALPAESAELHAVVHDWALTADQPWALEAWLNHRGEWHAAEGPEAMHMPLAFHSIPVMQGRQEELWRTVDQKAASCLSFLLRVTPSALRQTWLNTSHQGRTPLHAWVSEGMNLSLSPEVLVRGATVCLRYGARHDEKDIEGNTSLSGALRQLALWVKSLADLVDTTDGPCWSKLLRQLGPTLNDWARKNAAGVTPLAYWQSMDHFIGLQLCPDITAWLAADQLNQDLTPLSSSTIARRPRL